MKKNIKNIIIFLIILAVAGVAYFMFFGKTSTPAATTSNSALQTSTGTAPVNSVVNPNPITGAEATKISQEFVNQLLNLQAIKLNDEILSSLAFQSLQDFSIVLVQPGNEGRPNPFAPFGADGLDAVDSLGDGSVILWLSVKLKNVTIFYPSSWTNVPISETPVGASAAVVIGYTFNLPDGVIITWGGAQSTCSASTYPTFQYGASTITCVKNVTVKLEGEDHTAETKETFGEFIQKNK